MAANQDKLGQSLDDILKTNRSSGRRGRGRKGAGTGRPAAANAPVGGVQKAAKPAKKDKAIPTGPSGGSGESKIIISNLPPDVEAQQLKEYLSRTIGAIKKVFLTYGPEGRSRGIATVVFGKPQAASDAAKELDGVKIDNRAMRVEVILAAKDAPPPPPAKSLSERISQPKQAKAQPKPVTAANKPKAASGRGRGGKRGRGGRNTRAPKKTAEELDAEMADYFTPGNNAGGDAMVTNGGAVQAPNGDTGMDDEMI